MNIVFTIPGEPVAQGRPRFTTRNGFARAYDPAKSRDYKSIVSEVARLNAPDKPLEGPLSLTLIVKRCMPKSFSKKKRQEAIAGLVRPTTKPDVDNYVKGIKDALNGIIWLDDSQVVYLTAAKFYSDDPRVEVIVTELS